MQHHKHRYRQIGRKTAEQSLQGLHPAGRGADHDDITVCHGSLLNKRAVAGPPSLATDLGRNPPARRLHSC
ncbi:hypothetical protein [Dechloromonas hankyongensis]|uniref:hypothetical protein n=1 Tax=Dechloromonas hankyongensis TaxID=2908002 RepID=UPI0023DC660D|nr:hypothetical protein [Dechloromonas hankyongensis]